MLSHICGDSRLKIVNSAINDAGFKISGMQEHGDEWFNLVQKRKSLFREREVFKKEREAMLPIRVRDFEEKIALMKANAKANRPSYENKSEVTPQNLWKIIPVISAWSGLGKSYVKTSISDLNEELGDLTLATRLFWNSVELRSDKPIVSLDLEVAAPLYYGDVDMGMSGSIIEVGYVKIFPNGDVEHGGYLCGVEEDYMKTIGTGAVDIHNITPRMVEGLTPFSMDIEKQESFIELVRNSVIIAHNAEYEVKQLSSSIPGIAELFESGKIEVLDTRFVAKYLIGDLPDNTNKSFVEASGGVYEGAHRAYDDALMTLNALLKCKGLKPLS